MDLRQDESASIWTQLHASSPSSSHASPTPAARSGLAMTVLSPTRSVLLFGGADGKTFFEDIFLIEPARIQGIFRPIALDSCHASVKRPAINEFQWKKLVVSHENTSGSPLARASGIISTLKYPGGGRDYHTMHYVESSVEEEKMRGMRVLIVGNIVVATDQATFNGPRVHDDTGVAFDTCTLRIEELRVQQGTLQAQWVPQRLDGASMWKPRARHAHSSVVVGGDQVFVFGGKDATSTTFFNDLFYYDAPLNQWVQPRGTVTGQVPQPRAFAGLTASTDGRTLFLFGGTDGKHEFGSLFRYDVQHCRWESLAGATVGDRPSCRINHSLTYVAPHHLVLFGGRQRALRQNELYIYNITTRSWRLMLDSSAPKIGRTAHATVLFHSEPAGPRAVQELIIFGGYAGKHEWLNDLYILSLSQAALMLPPRSLSDHPSHLTAVTRRTLPVIRSTGSSRKGVALSAPQHESNARQGFTSELKELAKEATQESLLAPLIAEPETEFCQNQQPPAQQRNAAVSSSPPQPSISRNLSRPGTGSSTTILTDITNQFGLSSPYQQEETVYSGAMKSTKRPRLDSQDNSCIKNNGELTSVGIQTMVLQLLQHQPRVDDILGRILAMQKREQTARLQQRRDEELMRRLFSDEQRKLFDAASRRNEALDEKLACLAADCNSLHEKLKARETEVYFQKPSLEEAIEPLNERVEAIEASHAQQLSILRQIESKISVCNGFIDDVCHTDGTSLRQLPRRSMDSAPSSTPLFFPQQVVVALEEKIQVMQSENDVLKAQHKEMAEKLKKMETREALARQFFTSWCQQESHTAANLEPSQSVE
ncbi:hypothetical protein CCR75_007262 [Bremia lactucae]|uniref:Uncharacterized protein n=1 Tax=Bremia lactucae TaxID=4779 RepID=A0A976IH33_BRELC|nr:hypothetical protein CCR75_007262 [Bremia lactucae]